MEHGTGTMAGNDVATEIIFQRYVTIPCVVDVGGKAHPERKTVVSGDIKANSTLPAGDRSPCNKLEAIAAFWKANLYGPRNVTRGVINVYRIL